jgi:hypothetical protein
MHINHVSKLEFLCAFREAFFASITEKNIQGGFTGAGLVPYDPGRVLSKLDVKLRTLTPPTTRAGTLQPWVFQTPHNPREADSQSTLIKTRIASHQNSSPTSMLAAVDQLTKGTIAVMHQVALLQSEVSSLRKANEALSKRRRAKKNTCATWRITYYTGCTEGTRPGGRGWGGSARNAAREWWCRGVVRGFGAVVCAASLAIMLELARRMQKH